MIEKPQYFGLYKEGPVWKVGNSKDSSVEKKFSDIVQKIDRKQRLLYLEWDGSNIFLGVQFHCSSVSSKDSRPVRDSRRMYLEQVPLGKNDSPNLSRILQEFYQRGDDMIKSFYAERYDNIQMKLATSGDFEKFISEYIPRPPQLTENGISKFFGGKILFAEQCTVFSSDFNKSIKMITDLFDVLKNDKKNLVFIISELDNPNDTKPEWDLLIKSPIRESDKTKNSQLFTYNADIQAFSETSYTQELYKIFYNYMADNRPWIQKKQDSATFINNFIQSIISSKDSVKMPIGELCKSKLGKKIAKELMIKKLNSNDKVDSDILKLVYTSQSGAEQGEFGRILLEYGYDFPELYSDVIKKIILESDQNFLSHFMSKDFPEYRNFHTNLASTIKKLPWDDTRFPSNARKILELIFSKFMPDKVGEGGKIFTRLLYQTLYDRQEIDREFILNYSERMRFFDIKVPSVPDKSLLSNPKLRWSILGYVAFAAGFFFAMVFSWFKTTFMDLLQTPIFVRIYPIPVWVMISGVIIVFLLLGYFIFKKGVWKKFIRK